MTEEPPDRLEAAAKWVAEAYDEMLAARYELYRELRKRRERGGRQPAVCGTPAGYRRHQRLPEPACVPCIEAWNWDYQRRQNSPTRMAG